MSVLSIQPNTVINITHVKICLKLLEHAPTSHTDLTFDVRYLNVVSALTELIREKH